MTTFVNVYSKITRNKWYQWLIDKFYTVSVLIDHLFLFFSNIQWAVQEQCSETEMEFFVKFEFVSSYSEVLCMPYKVI